MATAIRLGAVYDPHRNSLNLIRLILATSVIVWHAFPLSGADTDLGNAGQLLGDGGVDGFFAISGFLIVSSWMRSPHMGKFIRARILRIFPAFWVCLIVTPALFAPVAILLSGQKFPTNYLADAVKYVAVNAALSMNQYDIAGTPVGVPYPNVWDGSLWTLFWEFLCYLVVLAFGVLGILKRGLTIPVLFLLSIVGVAITDYGPVENYWVTNGSRFGVMFLAGAVIYALRNYIPVTRLLIAGAGLLVVISAVVLEHFAIVAALPLAYLVLSVGALAKNPRLSLKNDFSYGIYIYGFPVQQVLATAGVAGLGVPIFALVSIIATIPFAVASWFLIEKRALRLKDWRLGRRRAVAPILRDVPSGGAPD